MKIHKKVVKNEQFHAVLPNIFVCLPLFSAVYSSNMQAHLTVCKGGKKRCSSSGRKSSLAKSRKKKATNAEERKSQRNRKKLLKERKKELMSHRKGKAYSLVCWAILFVGIINLLLGEFSISTWKAAKLEAVLHDLDPVNLHQKFIYYVKTRKFSSFADFFLLKSERRRCG